MFRRARNLPPLDQRVPLRVMFMIDELSVGGAEMLLYELILRIDRTRLAPALCCMHALGELGEKLQHEVPVFANLLNRKYDATVVRRLIRILNRQETDAIVTVGAGDRMFWGRLAAYGAGVPVVVAAIHSTGWPDRIGRLNRLLTPLTDAFVGVAAAHGRYLVEKERFPGDRVHVIYNGVDSQRYGPRPRDHALLDALHIPRSAKLVGLVAVMRPEKNHELFLRTAAIVRQQAPDTHFILVGNGPEYPRLERRTADLKLTDAVHFLGARNDVPDLLPLFDVFLLTSRIEASPVSILEAQACGVPVVATRVGSVPESVLDGQTGMLVSPDSPEEAASAVLRILNSPDWARSIAAAARQFVVEHRSLDAMVRGYENLISCLYEQKTSGNSIESRKFQNRGLAPSG